jgi:predicted nucleotidyltransferase
MPAATLPEVLEVLRARREEARAIGIELVGVVGSLARGEARPDSDVDVIVHHLGGCSLFKLIDFEGALQKIVGRSVDLVFSEAMRPERRRYIERDLIPL